VRSIILTYILKMRITMNYMDHLGFQTRNVGIGNLTEKEAHDKGFDVWIGCYTCGDNREKHNVKVAEKSA